MIYGCIVDVDEIELTRSLGYDDGVCEFGMHAN